MNNLPYGTLRAFLTPFLMLLFRPKVKGLRNVPASGPLILASNHLSFSDSIFMPLVVPRKVTFLAKSEYFTSPGLKGFAKKKTFQALGQVPVDRSGGRRVGRCQFQRNAAGRNAPGPAGYDLRGRLRRPRLQWPCGQHRQADSGAPEQDGDPGKTAA